MTCRRKLRLRGKNLESGTVVIFGATDFGESIDDSSSAGIIQRKLFCGWRPSRACRDKQLTKVFLGERAVARPSTAKRINEAERSIKPGIFLGRLRNRTVERCERLAPYRAVGIRPHGRRLGSEADELVERRGSMRCGHAARKRAALGNERTLQTLNEKIQQSDAIRPSVGIDETSGCGAFYGAVDL